MSKPGNPLPKFKFRVRDDRPAPVVVHGAAGGLTQGMVVAHLHSEHSELPAETQLLELTPKYQQRHVVVREVHSCIMMPPECAISIGHWLIRHGEQALQARRDAILEEENAPRD